LIDDNDGLDTKMVYKLQYILSIRLSFSVVDYGLQEVGPASNIIHLIT